MFEAPNIKIEKKNEILEFDKFSFSDINSFNIKTNEQIEQFTETKDVDYNGTTLEFDFEHGVFGSSENFTLLIKKDGSTAIIMLLFLSSGSNYVEMRSNLKKAARFQKDQSLKGLGVKIYVRMFDFFQHLADTRGMEFVHVVEKGPEFYETNADNSNDLIKMDDRRMSKMWDGIFLDLLSERGYLREQGLSRQWTKKYKIGYDKFNNKYASFLDEKRAKELEEMEMRQRERIEKLEEMEKEGKLYIHE